MDAKDTIRILLAEDHEVVRDGFIMLLETEPDFNVVGSAADGMSAVKMARELMPDVVLMDLSLPIMNGIDATWRIREDVFSAKVIGLSMHTEKTMVSALLRAGASGYVLKDGGWRELVDAIREVHGGGTHVSLRVSDSVIESFLNSRSTRVQSASSLLTKPELEVLQLIAKGKNSRTIGELLHISTSTVSSRRAHIMKKLDLHGVAALTRFALRDGAAAA
jgi:DNA-binding NarL/FixJ family response regulator